MDGRHEGRRRRAAEAGGGAHDVQRRCDVDVVRPRGGRGRTQRSDPPRAEQPRAVRRRLRDPRRTVQRAGGGRLQRQPARRRAHRRGQSPQCALVDRRERDPQGRSHPRPPRGVPRAGGHRRRPRLPRGAQRGARARRGGRQRHPRRVRGRGELPVRAQSRRRRGGAPCARGLRGLRRRGRRPRRRGATRARFAAGAGVPHGRRCRTAPEVRVDGRGTVLGHGRSRRQLRSRRPAPRTSRRGAGPRGADRRGRARSASVADRVTERAEASAPSLWTRPALRVALVYLSARVVTSAFFVLASALAPADARHGQGATIGTYVLAWDAQWYWLIAFQGYPTELPLTEAGRVAENAWAFMPLYPALSAVVAAPFGHWGVGAFLVTLTAGYGCALVLHRMFRERLGESAALWGVVFFSAGPLAALLQVGYAEALFLLIPLMGFTRPGVLAFALFLALYGLWRLTRRTVEPVTRRDVVHILALGALATIVGFSWQVIAAVVTTDASAYLETELAWRRQWVGDTGGFLPFEGWVQGATFWS